MMDKPTEITVRHFFEHRYAQKVANRECVVRDWANGIIEDVVPLLEKGYCVKFDYRANTGYYSEGNSLLTVEWLTPVTPLPGAAGDNTRVLCDWCGQQPAVHGGECDDCWRLPGHEGEGAESAEVVELRAENARLRAAVEAAGKREALLRTALLPFAKAYEEIPEGLRSTLRIWDGDEGILHLKATTDHMKAAYLAEQSALANAGTGEV